MNSHAAQVVLLALALSCYVAHAQDASVSVYGRINLALVAHGGSGPGQSSTATQNSLSSRLGFKAQEELGAGLIASVVVETGIGADVGSGTLGNRETSLGLQGRFGKVRIGYMLTPFDDFHSIAGPGYFNNVSNDNINGFWANGYSNLYGAASKPCDGSVPGTDDNNNFSFDGRYANSLRYDAPVIGDVAFATHVALGESGVPGCASRAWSSKLQYVAHGWNAGLAFDQHFNARGAGLNDTIVLATAAYRFSPAYALSGYVQRVRYAHPGGQDLRQVVVGVNGKRSDGAHMLELGWYRAGKGHGEQTPVFSGIFVGSDTEAHLLALAYHYALSRRTDLWAQFIEIRNASHAAYALGNSGKAGAPGSMGAHPHALIAGLRHDF